MTHEEAANLPIDTIIDYLESTEEDSWCMDVVRTEDGKNCIFGHLFNLGGGILMDTFEARWATTYMLYPINNGENENYQQSTPKQRCITYLKNLRDGKEMTTHESMEHDYNLWKESESKEIDFKPL